MHADPIAETERTDLTAGRDGVKSSRAAAETVQPCPNLGFPPRLDRERWHGRLRRIDAASVTRLNALSQLATEARWVLGDGLHLSLGAVLGIAPEDTVELGGDGVWIALSAVAVDAPPDRQRWRELDGLSRLIEWGLAHEPVVDAFSRWLGRTLAPTWLHPAHDLGHHHGAGAVFAYRLHRAQSLSHVGIVWLTREALALALERSEAMPRDAFERIDCTREVRFAFDLRVPAVTLRLEQAQTLGLHDVIVLGRRPNLLERIELWPRGSGSQMRCALAWSKGRAEVVGWNTGQATSISSMRTEMKTADSNTAGRAPGAFSLAQLPVRIAFDLGSLELSLDQVRQLAPGHVFELPLALDSAKVGLLANGQPIGHGELTAVGDVLGVRILALADGTGG